MYKSTNNGISILHIVGIVFIILKLFGAIDWAWWWILAPFWFPLAIIAIFLITAAIIGVLELD